jgi:hypothetical protein
MMASLDRRFRGTISHLRVPALLLACLLTATSGQAQSPVPHLSSNSDIATAGFFRLSWETDAAQVELQEANNDTFSQAHTYYKGADRAAVVSGKANGTWYYRIRAIDEGQAGPWSSALLVTVAHHSLSRALLFFAVGLLVFVAIAVVVIRGAGESA